MVRDGRQLRRGEGRGTGGVAPAIFLALQFLELRAAAELLRWVGHFCLGLAFIIPSHYSVRFYLFDSKT